MPGNHFNKVKNHPKMKRLAKMIVCIYIHYLPCWAHLQTDVLSHSRASSTAAWRIIQLFKATMSQNQVFDELSTSHTHFLIVQSELLLRHKTDMKVVVLQINIIGIETAAQIKVPYFNFFVWHRYDFCKHLGKHKTISRDCPDNQKRLLLTRPWFRKQKKHFLLDSKINVLPSYLIKNGIPNKQKNWHKIDV